MIALALALAAAQAGPAAMLRPVFDRAYRLTIAEERSVSGRLRHFTAERRLVFRRDGSGVVAEVTLTRIGQDIGGEAGRRFEAGAGALLDRTIRFRLGGDGSLIGIDDEASVWATMTAALRAIGDARAAPGSPIRDPQAAMAGLSPDAARATIASIILPVIAGADAARAAGTRRVSVPSGPVASGAPLTGTETATTGTDGLLHIALHASAVADDRAVSLNRDRSLDTAHGLVLRQDETQTVRLGAGVQVTRKSTLLFPPV